MAVSSGPPCKATFEPGYPFSAFVSQSSSSSSLSPFQLPHFQRATSAPALLESVSSSSSSLHSKSLGFASVDGPDTVLQYLEQQSAQPSYPSPSSMSSDSMQNMPLPDAHEEFDSSSSFALSSSSFSISCPSSPSFSNNRTFGGLLDSPIVMLRRPLKPRDMAPLFQGHDVPLSPPATTPTPTHELPPTNELDLPMASERDKSLPRAHAADALQFFSIPRILDQSETNPLSPISPEWTSNRMPLMPAAEQERERCCLLNTSPQLCPSRIPVEQRHPSLPSSEPSGSRPRLLHLDIPSNGTYPSPESPEAEPLSWNEQDEQMEKQLSWDDRDEQMDTRADDDASSPPLSSSSDLDDSYLYSPDMPSAKPLDLAFDLDDITSRPPSFPFLDSYEPFKYPSSPSIRTFNGLPEFDDDDNLSPPFSPSRRSFSSLPELDFDLDDDVGEENGMLSPPASPNMGVRSLPGGELPAEEDDLMFAPDLPLTQERKPEHLLPLSPFAPSPSLLLIDDPNDVPPPRSPSPENFTIDSSLLDSSSDAELLALYDLRRRTQAAERAARQAVDDAGQVNGEARGRVKRAKARGREVSCLLRLKLKERGVDVELGASPRKKVSKKPHMTSVPQLVASMLMARHEPRAMGARRPTTTWGAVRRQGYPSSPLARPALVLEEDDEERKDDEMDSLSLDEGWSTSSWLDHPPPFAVGMGGMEVDDDGEDEGRLEGLDLLSPL